MPAFGARWSRRGDPPTAYERIHRVGPGDLRPCGCVTDPVVFGHGCQQPDPVAELRRWLAGEIHGRPDSRRRTD